MPQLFGAIYKIIANKQSHNKDPLIICKQNIQWFLNVLPEITQQTVFHTKCQTRYAGDARNIEAELNLRTQIARNSVPPIYPSGRHNETTAMIDKQTNRTHRYWIDPFWCGLDCENRPCGHFNVSPPIIISLTFPFWQCISFTNENADR